MTGTYSHGSMQRFNSSDNLRLGDHFYSHQRGRVGLDTNAGDAGSQMQILQSLLRQRRLPRALSQSGDFPVRPSHNIRMSECLYASTSVILPIFIKLMYL